MATMPVLDAPSVAEAATSHRLRGRLTLAVMALVIVSAVVARFPGLNPDSLWYDDLAWAVYARLGNLRTMIFGGNAPPGFLAILWASSTIFRDPEWSMQLFPFLCGLASIPVMGGVLWRITKSHGLAILAAALTALNPMLAHYTVFVKAYAVDFLVTGLLIYTTVPLLLDDEIRPWSAVQLLIVASLGVLVSATSVFVSVPAVNAVAIRALMRRDQSSSALLLLPAILFDGAFLLGAVWFRFAHYGGIHAGYDVSRDLFQRLLHPNRLYRFVKHRMLEDIARGLPSWIETDVWNPAAVEWSLIFAVIGLVWLLLRRSTRAIGVFLLVVLIGFAVAAYTDLYPLTTARRSIFCYPVTITLAAMSPEALTAWWSRRSIVQLVVGVMVAAFAVYAPVRVTYWDVDDARLVTRLTTVLTPSDDLILSPASAYLTAYYGRWRATVPKEHLIEGRAVSIIRDGTLQLPTNKGARVAALQAFLQSPLPDRICYVAFRTGPDETNDVLSALNDHGYATEVLETTTLGKLYLGHR